MSLFSRVCHRVVLTAVVIIMAITVSGATSKSSVAALATSNMVTGRVVWKGALKSYTTGQYVVVTKEGYFRQSNTPEKYTIYSDGINISADRYMGEIGGLPRRVGAQNPSSNIAVHPYKSHGRKYIVIQFPNDGFRMFTAGPRNGGCYLRLSSEQGYANVFWVTS